MLTTQPPRKEYATANPWSSPRRLVRGCSQEQLVGPAVPFDTGRRCLVCHSEEWSPRLASHRSALAPAAAHQHRKDRRRAKQTAQASL